jgi:hypothetical protein
MQSLSFQEMNSFHHRNYFGSEYYAGFPSCRYVMQAPRAHQSKTLENLKCLSTSVGCFRYRNLVVQSAHSFWLWHGPLKLTKVTA